MTYILLAIAVLIWGVIIFKIVLSAPKTGADPIIKPESKTKQDTIRTLSLDYRDPFHPAPVKPAVPVKAAKQTIRPIAMPQSMDLALIGRLRNGKKEYYIIESEGMQYTISAGEAINGLKLIKASRDSLYFTKGALKQSIALYH